MSIFRNLDVGSVGPIVIHDSPSNAIFNNKGQSVDVFFRSYYDIPRSLEFKNAVMDPQKNFFVLYNKHLLEIKPIKEPNQVMKIDSTVNLE